MKPTQAADRKNLQVHGTQSMVEPVTSRHRPSEHGIPALIPNLAPGVESMADRQECLGDRHLIEPDATVGGVWRYSVEERPWRADVRPWCANSSI